MPPRSAASSTKATDVKAVRRAAIEGFNRLAAAHNLAALDRDAPKHQVKQLWRELALKIHPDKDGPTDDMQELNRLRALFGDFEDQRRAAQAEPPTSQSTDAPPEPEPAAPTTAVVPQEAQVMTVAGAMQCPRSGEDNSQQSVAVYTPTVPVPVLTTFDTMGLLCTWNSRAFEWGTWVEFRRWVLDLVSFVGCTRFTATMELSLRGHCAAVLAGHAIIGDPEPTDDHHCARIHFHCYFEWPQKFSSFYKDPRFAFQGSHPNIRQAIGNRHLRKILDQGHFYVWAWKIGTAAVDANYLPWCLSCPRLAGNYKPELKWIDDLWSAHKIDHVVYGDYILNHRVQYPIRKAWLEAVFQECAKRRRRLEQDAAARLIAFPGEFVTHPVVAEFFAQFDEARSRYCVLGIRSPSRCGKTEFAKQLLRAPFVVNVEDALYPNLREYERDVHTGVVFDNVNDPTFILRNRSVFQCRNEVMALSQTTTQLYTYPVYLWRVPLIFTMDIEVQWPDPCKDKIL